VVTRERVRVKSHLQNPSAKIHLQNCHLQKSICKKSICKIPHEKILLEKILQLKTPIKILLSRVAEGDSKRIRIGFAYTRPLNSLFQA
jgi:hypothetical protein